jgi:4-diphosphocytidyl-2C-methyl-D-erythritol kinase
MMSGSGPTVFGLFKEFASAEAARHHITNDTNWFSATVETI